MFSTFSQATCKMRHMLTQANTGDRIKTHRASLGRCASIKIRADRMTGLQMVGVVMEKLVQSRMLVQQQAGRFVAVHSYFTANLMDCISIHRDLDGVELPSMLKGCAFERICLNPENRGAAKMLGAFEKIYHVAWTPNIFPYSTRFCNIYTLCDSDVSFKHMFLPERYILYYI